MTQPLNEPLPLYDPRHVAAMHAVADKLAELKIVSPTAIDLTRFVVPAADFNHMVIEHGWITNRLHRSGRHYASIPLGTDTIACDFVIYEALPTALTEPRR